jgi:hypothetical protein
MISASLALTFIPTSMHCRIRHQATYVISLLQIATSFPPWYISLYNYYHTLVSKLLFHSFRFASSLEISPSRIRITHGRLGYIPAPLGMTPLDDEWLRRRLSSCIVLRSSRTRWSRSAKLLVGVVRSDRTPVIWARVSIGRRQFSWVDLRLMGTQIIVVPSVKSSGRQRHLLPS